MSIKWPNPKDPADIAWYEVDCAGILNEDTIATAAFTAPDGIEKVAETSTDTTARIKIGGGEVGVYTFILDLTTAGGQTFQRDVILKVKNL